MLGCKRTSCPGPLLVGLVVPRSIMTVGIELEVVTWWRRGVETTTASAML